MEILDAGKCWQPYVYLQIWGEALQVWLGSGFGVQGIKPMYQRFPSALTEEGEAGPPHVLL